MSERDNGRVVATLYGGPANRVRLWVDPDPTWSSPWPGYICLNMRQGLPMHYTLVSDGVYEFAGACAEFDHDPEKHQQRCPDCGAQILGEQHREHRPGA